MAKLYISKLIYLSMIIFVNSSFIFNARVRGLWIWKWSDILAKIIETSYLHEILIAWWLFLFIISVCWSPRSFLRWSANHHSLCIVDLLCRLSWNCTGLLRIDNYLSFVLRWLTLKHPQQYFFFVTFNFVGWFIILLYR
jgi:hypothetical protein